MRCSLKILIVLLLVLIQIQAKAQIDREYTDRIQDSVNIYLQQRALPKREAKLDTMTVNKGTVRVLFKKGLAEYPIREDDIPALQNIVRNNIPDEYRKYNICILSDGTDIKHYVSKYYSRKWNKKDQRKPSSGTWIRQTDRPYKIPNGLEDRNIALWGGHGMYYCLEESRWKWQRAPYFTTIEDVLPHSLLVDYIIPMLENAGANVLIPRERDFNTNEIIVDNTSPFYSERNSSSGTWIDATSAGYRPIDVIWSSDVNPFTMGKARMVAASKKNKATASFLPFFPETEEYAVYVTYPSLPKSGIARYTVRHSGGETGFTIDQSKGGSTWVYLGTFTFTKGESGQGVIVSNLSTKASNGEFISADAVRFGGGMGIVARDSMLSGMSKFIEAGRYSLQAYGFSPEVFSPKEDCDDYKDDYISKGLWVNALVHDLGIPVDMALALHTDAGIKQGDSIVGTLAIYKEVSDGSKFYSDGSPRRTARELSEVIQTTIVEDIKALYMEQWNRREIWDRSYMEARTPDVPTVLIELLSHQNRADMEAALDPEFRFIAARAIYKGILKYLAYAYGTDYTVQPLPVKNPALTMKRTGKGGTELHLSWSPSADALELSATPEMYLVQSRVSMPEDTVLQGFDKGVIVKDTAWKTEIEPGKIYSYRVIALNDGGASFPSEVLSAGYVPYAEQVLVINGFTDVRGPDPTTGKGIPYIKSHSLGGRQFNFDTAAVWLDDYRPGYGASFLDYIGTEVAGNTFDYPVIHGRAIMKAGYSFVSTSIGAFEEKRVPLDKYQLCDIIFGEEEDVFTPVMTSYLSDYCRNGGSLIISGSNIGKASCDPALSAASHKFASDILKIKWINNYVSTLGKVICIQNGQEYQFNTEPCPEIYTVIQPDSFIPTDRLAKPIMKYHGSNSPAAIFYDGDDYRCAIFGFPLEALTSQPQIDALISDTISRIFK